MPDQANLQSMIVAGEKQYATKMGASCADPLANLPRSITDNRVLGTNEAAALTGYSVQHLRELYRTGQFPQPIRLSARRYGWKARDVLAWLDAKAAA